MSKKIAWNKGLTIETDVRLFQKYKKKRNKIANFLRENRNKHFCQCGCGQKLRMKKCHYYQQYIPKYVQGHNKSTLGKKNTEEHKQKISESAKGRVSPMKGKCQTEESRRRMSDSQKGLKKPKRTIEHCNNLSKVNKGNSKLIKSQKDYWDSIPIDRKEKHLKNIILNNKIKPNRKEQILQNIINSMFFENQFQINILGGYLIGGKIPDFIDPINNKIIELYGDYWHKGQDPNDRINYFKNYGYDTLIIWEHELKDIKNVKNKLWGFINA